MLYNQGCARRFASEHGIVVTIVVCAVFIASAISTSMVACVVDMQKVLVVDKLGLLVVDVCMRWSVQAGSDANGEHKSYSVMACVAVRTGKQLNELDIIGMSCKEPLVQGQQLPFGRNPCEPVNLVLDIQQAGLDGQLGNVERIAGERSDGDPDDLWLSCLCFAMGVVSSLLATFSAIFVVMQSLLR